MEIKNKKLQTTSAASSFVHNMSLSKANILKDTMSFKNVNIT